MGSVCNWKHSVLRMRSISCQEPSNTVTKVYIYVQPAYCRKEPGRSNISNARCVFTVNIFYFFFFNGSSSPFRAQASYSVPKSFFTGGRTPWTSDQPIAWPLPTHRKTQTQNKRIHTRNIHALSGIWTHDPSVRASEDSSCLRPRCCCDRLTFFIALLNTEDNVVFNVFCT
jgi:hypothetical protein